MFVKDCKNGAKCYYMRTKGLSPITVFESGTKLSFKFPYKGNDGQHYNLKGTFILSVKNGRLNVYERIITDGGKKVIRNISTKCDTFRNKVRGSVNTHYFGKKFENEASHLPSRERAIPGSGVVQEARLYTVQSHQNHLKKWIVEKLKDYGVDTKVRNVKNIEYDQILRMGCYPILADLYKHSGHDHSYLLKIIKTRKMRDIENVRDITKTVFKSTNRRLVREVGESFKKNVSSLIYLGAWLKDSLPIDYYKNFQYISSLQAPVDGVGPYIVPEKNVVRLFLENYNPKRRLTLIESCTDWMDLYDTSRQWYDGRERVRLPESPRDIRELHDLLSMDYRRLRTTNYDLPIHKKWAELDGFRLKYMEGIQLHRVDEWELDKIKLPYREFEIVLPKTAHELVEWGSKMSNCVASYASRVRDRECIIVGIFREGTIQYCLEIRGAEVIQFRARRNNAPDREDEKNIRKFFYDKGLINNGSTYGYDVHGDVVGWHRAPNANDIVRLGPIGYEEPGEPIRVNPQALEQFQGV